MSHNAREWLCEQAFISDDKQRAMLMNPSLTHVSVIAMLLDLMNHGFFLMIHKTHKEAVEVILLDHKLKPAEVDTDYYQIFLRTAEESVWCKEAIQYPGYIYLSIDDERG